MAATTRADTLKHLLTAVLDKTENDEPYALVYAHHRCRSAASFSKLTDAQLKAQFLFDPTIGGQNRVLTTLATADFNELCELQEFIRHHRNDATHDWMQDTDVIFQEFQDSLVGQTQAQAQAQAAQALLQAQAVQAQADAAAAAAAANAQRTGGANSMLTAYKMKRQYSDYKEITKRHFFTSWNKELKVTAITHNCSNPLNHAYVPVTADEQAVWTADQAFMMGVFIQKIKYPSGQTIVSHHLDDMDAQTAYRKIVGDATSEIVVQINENKLEDALRDMDASPDKWNKTLEAFLDMFEVKLVQLNDSRNTAVPDRDTQAWLIHSLRNHVAAMSAVNQMRQLELHQKRINPAFASTFGSFKEGLRVSFQQWDSENRPKPSPRVKADDKDGKRRANKAQQAEDKRSDSDKKAGLEQYQKDCKALGLWLEPAVFKKMTDAQKLAHKEKVRAMRRAKTTQTANTAETTPAGTTPAAAAASPPPSYAQAAQVAPTPAAHQVQQALQAHYPNGGPPVFTYMGKTYRSMMANRAYKASGKASSIGSLVDGGCNGGLAGADVLIMDEHSFGKVDIVGVADNLIKNIPLCTAAGLIQTNDGPIIGIMHNYAALKTGGSIHSPLQFKDHGILVDDTPKSQRRFDGECGRQSVRIPSGDGSKLYDVALTIKGGLAYFAMRPPTDAELNDETIPHVHLTSDMPWNPSKYDDDVAEAPTAPFSPFGHDDNNDALN
jgi:hypothetical protein